MTKLKKFENWADTQIIIWFGSKKIFGSRPRDPIIGSMGYGGGSTPVVKGMDSYPASVFN